MPPVCETDAQCSLVTRRIDERVGRIERRQDEVHELVFGTPSKPEQGLGSRVPVIESHLHDIRDDLKRVFWAIVIVGLGVIARELFG